MIKADWFTVPGTYPKTIQELLSWQIGQGNDTYGNFTIVTGFEGTGGCFWCGKELPEGRHRRYCPERSHKDFISCYRLYQNFFAWPDASSWCLRRYEHRCAFCGKEEEIIEDGFRHGYHSNLEVHHIFPLKGKPRVISPYNVQWNLLPLCHEHHQIVHALLRIFIAGNTASRVDVFKLAQANGQSVMESFISVPKVLKI